MIHLEIRMAPLKCCWCHRPTAPKTPLVRLCIGIRLPVHKFRHQEQITCREYIRYKNPYTDNRVGQALPTVWKPRRDRERAEMGNSNGWKKYWYRYRGIYRAMLYRARLWDCMSSVRLSVTLRYDFHTGWNTSKINSRPNSLRPLLSLTPNMGDLVQREHPQN